MSPSETQVKPTILLLPGAWLSLSTYDAFLSVLKESGYPTASTPLPSLNLVDPSKGDIETDAAIIREKTLLPLLDEGKDVVIVMHSWSGVPGSVAAIGLGKEHRASQGKKGGVVGLVYISGALMPGGYSAADYNQGNLWPWIKEDSPKPGLCTVIDPATVFYANVEASLVEEDISQLQPHASLVFRSKGPDPAWTEPSFKGRLGYIVLTEDLATPQVVQEAMIGSTGQEFIKEEMVSSHVGLFLNKSRETAKMVEGICQRFP